jgi:hypothetical protein
MLEKKQQKNPASAFLTMAAFNVVGAIVFIVFYFLYDRANGTNSYYLLIAAGFAVLSAGGALFAYSHFKRKFERQN